MKKTIFLLLMLCVMLGLQAKPVDTVTGQLLCKNSTVDKAAAIYVLDAKHENVILTTKADKEGKFTMQLKPARYNLYVNGEFVKSFLKIDKSINLELQVDTYVFMMAKPKKMAGLLALPLVIGGTAAIQVAAVVAVSASGPNKEDNEQEPVSVMVP